MEWNDFGSWIEKAGSSHWLGKGYLIEKHIYPVSLLVHWKVSEKESWYLAPSLLDREMALRAYARRMWIEEMFGDMKKHGFDLESTTLRHADRLPMTLAVALFYFWLISTCNRVIRDGLRYLADRRKRCDLCIFQIGFRLINHQLLNSLPFNISLCYYG